MHLVLEFNVDLVVVEVCVREKPIQSTADVVQVLLRVGWDGNSIEVVGVHETEASAWVRAAVVEAVVAGFPRSSLFLSSASGSSKYPSTEQPPAKCLRGLGLAS